MSKILKYLSPFSHLLNRIEILAVYIFPLNKAGRPGEEVMDGFEWFHIILCPPPFSSNGRFKSVLILGYLSI